jgi:hypothetical protein
VAVGSVAGVANGAAALAAAFLSFTGFTATLVRFELFVAFLFCLFTIVCPLHGTREPYACLERSKVLIEYVMCALRQERRFGVPQPVEGPKQCRGNLVPLSVPLKLRLTGISPYLGGLSRGLSHSQYWLVGL